MEQNKGQDRNGLGRHFTTWDKLNQASFVTAFYVELYHGHAAIRSRGGSSLTRLQENGAFDIYVETLVATIVLLETFLLSGVVVWSLRLYLNFGFSSLAFRTKEYLLPTLF